MGTGAFSRVILATSNEGTKVAVKCISKNSELKQEDIDSLHEEVAVLRSVDHPNIVKLYDFFDEKRYYYMAIELMEGGELFERIVKKTFYNEMDARGLVRILLDALAYLHHRGIVHRDLKPENLLLKSPFNDFDIKLADFGFVRTPASFFSHGRGVARVLIRSPCEVSAARAPATRPATTPRRRPHRRGIATRLCSRESFSAEARRRQPDPNAGQEGRGQVPGYAVRHAGLRRARDPQGQEVRNGGGHVVVRRYSVHLARWLSPIS